MSSISPATALKSLDARTLRDIGLAPDGSVINEQDPRFRKIDRRTTLLNRLPALVALHVGGALLRA